MHLVFKAVDSQNFFKMVYIFFLTNSADTRAVIVIDDIDVSIKKSCDVHIDTEMWISILIDIGSSKKIVTFVIGTMKLVSRCFPPPRPKMPFTYVANVYSDMSLSKGHPGSRGVSI